MARCVCVRVRVCLALSLFLSVIVCRPISSAPPSPVILDKIQDGIGEQKLFPMEAQPDMNPLGARAASASHHNLFYRKTRRINNWSCPGGSPPAIPFWKGKHHQNLLILPCFCLVFASFCLVLACFCFGLSSFCLVLSSFALFYLLFVCFLLSSFGLFCQKCRQNSLL